MASSDSFQLLAYAARLPVGGCPDGPVAAGGGHALAERALRGPQDVRRYLHLAPQLGRPAVAAGPAADDEEVWQPGLVAERVDVMPPEDAEPCAQVGDRALEAGVGEDGDDLRHGWPPMRVPARGSSR